VPTLRIFSTLGLNLCLPLNMSLCVTQQQLSAYTALTQRFSRLADTALDEATSYVVWHEEFDGELRTSWEWRKTMRCSVKHTHTARELWWRRQGTVTVLAQSCTWHCGAIQHSAVMEAPIGPSCYRPLNKKWNPVMLMSWHLYTGWWDL